jgi:ATP-dependent DNA ligase
MLASSSPASEGWLFEPKWDGFRAIVFRDGDETYIQSRDLKPLDRYFPELPPALRASLPERCVVDGEIVIPGADGLDFSSLLLRIHPAASRVKMLAQQTPASFVGWDLLALGDDVDLRATGNVARSSARWPPRPSPHPGDARRGHRAPTGSKRFEGADLDGVV